MNEFENAVIHCMTCADCKHCQMNLKKADRTLTWICYHPEAKQTTLHSSMGMNITKDFLCNRFEEHDE